MTNNTLDNQEQTYKCVACGYTLKTADLSSIRCPGCGYKGLELFEENSLNTLDKEIEHIIGTCGYQGFHECWWSEHQNSISKEHAERRLAGKKPIKRRWAQAQLDALKSLIADREKSLDFDRRDYNRLKKLEEQGHKDYKEMRQAKALTPEAVVSFINQLSPWNLKTTGISILKAYSEQMLEFVIGENEENVMNRMLQEKQRQRAKEWR